MTTNIEAAEQIGADIRQANMETAIKEFRDNVGGLKYYSLKFAHALSDCSDVERGVVDREKLAGVLLGEGLIDNEEEGDGEATITPINFYVKEIDGKPVFYQVFECRRLSLFTTLPYVREEDVKKALVERGHLIYFEPVRCEEGIIDSDPFIYSFIAKPLIDETPKSEDYALTVPSALILDERTGTYYGLLRLTSNSNMREVEDKLNLLLNYLSDNFSGIGE